MTTIADYRVIQKSTFALGPIEAGSALTIHDFSFDTSPVASDKVESGSSKRPLLTFDADPSDDAEAIALDILFNGVLAFSYYYRGGVGRSHLVVLSHVNWSTSSYIPFLIRFNRNGYYYGDTGLSRELLRGTLFISNVVVWFLRDIDL